MSDARARLGWVDTGRGIAIVLVALYHAARWLVNAGFDTAGWQAANEILSSLRMPLFFALSGLFAGKWLTANWRDLWRAKLVLFLWVFIVWEVIGSVVFILGTAIDGQRVSIKDTVVALLISPVFPRLELWFIWALSIFFVLAKLTRSVNKWVQLGLAAIVSAVALTLWLSFTTGVTGSLKYYFFFLAGIYLRDLLINFGSLANRSILIGVLGLWVLISVGLSYFGIRQVAGLYFLNCLLGVLAGIVLSRALSRIDLIGWAGRNTLPIYLAHTPIIILASFALSLTALPVLMSQDLIVTPIVAVAAVAASLWLHRVCQRRVLRYLYEPPMHLLSRPRVGAGSERRA